MDADRLSDEMEAEEVRLAFRMFKSFVKNNKEERFHCQNRHHFVRRRPGVQKWSRHAKFFRITACERNY